MFELCPEQKYAVDWINKARKTNKHKGIILGDKMGIFGKTAPAIEVGKQTEGKKLILCPAYLLYNWISELDMWGVPASSVCVIDTKDQLLEEKEFYLMGYSRIRIETYKTPVTGEEKKRPNAIVRQLLKMRFGLIIADEAHILAGWNTQQSRFIVGTFQNKEKNFLHNSDNILLLTGTLFKNNIAELYNILIRIAPGTLNYMSKYEFFQQYAARIENTGFGIKAHGVKREAELVARLSPILLRRTVNKAMIPVNDETIKLDPQSPKLKKLFAEEEKFLLAHGIKPNDIEGITKITKTEISEIAGIRAQIAIAKIPTALAMLADIREDQEEPAPVAIYVYHRAVLAALKEALAAKYPKLRAAFIDGGTAAKERHEIVKNKFQTGELDVMCATIGALREGVNATAGRDVIFLELDFVPANIAQAIGRFQRRGQTGTVHVRKIVFNAGIEKRILKILAEKTTTIEKIIGK